MEELTSQGLVSQAALEDFPLAKLLVWSVGALPKTDTEV